MNCCDADSLYVTFGHVIRFHYYRTHTLLEKLGAYPGQPPLLFALAEHDGLSQRDLAKKLHIKAATLTIMLKRMEKTNLVERRQDRKDQRVIRVYLTEDGRQLQRKVKATILEVQQECFSGISEEDKQILHRLFLQMKDNLMRACGTNIGK